MLSLISVSSTSLTGPELFSEFFELGQEESASPFLRPDSRHWSANLTLKASILSAVLLLISFIFSFFPKVQPFSQLLLVGVYFLAGVPALIEALEDLFDGEINIDILMTLAAFSSVLIGSGMEGGLLLVLFALSGSMEDAVTNKAKGAVRNLHKLVPTKASVIEPSGLIVERALLDINVGTRILVKAGQVIPLDGVVVQGSSLVNLSHLTGENLPMTKSVGDQVAAGGRTVDGALEIEVSHLSSDSTLTRIIRLVTQAQEARPTLQRWFDKLSRGYAGSIIALSTLFALTFPFLFGIPFLGPEGSIYRALAFLIAASPCALIIAIPIAYLSAISACARKGILLKGGITLDALARCQTIAFDKTGTLTTGELEYAGNEPLNLQDKKYLDIAFSVAFALEKNAIHPMAAAILKQAEKQKTTQIPLTNFKVIPGYGLQADARLPEGTFSVFFGRPSYVVSKLPLEQQEALQQRIQLVKQQGELLSLLLIGTRSFIFYFQDMLRPKIADTLKAVKKRKLKTVMLTGDHQFSARRIANELGITEFYADLTPEDKLNYVSQLSEKGLAMIGDGINDAPALARATVGISMGKAGSAAAAEASDIVLLHDNIEWLDWLIEKAKKTQSIVKQNLSIAIAAILIASSPALAGVIPLWLAVVMHEGGTILVGLNALRLLRK